MTALEKLYYMLEQGHITPEEYEKKREYYEERLFWLYLNGKITEEELLERLDK